MVPYAVGGLALAAVSLLPIESLAISCDEPLSDDCGDSVASVSDETSSTTDLQTNDENNFRLTLGVDWTLKEIQSLVLSVEGDAVIGQRDQNEFGALINLRRTF